MTRANDSTSTGFPVTTTEDGELIRAINIFSCFWTKLRSWFMGVTGHDRFHRGGVCETLSGNAQTSATAFFSDIASPCLHLRFISFLFEMPDAMIAATANPALWPVTAPRWSGVKSACSYKCDNLRNPRMKTTGLWIVGKPGSHAVWLSLSAGIVHWSSVSPIWVNSCL